MVVIVIGYRTESIDCEDDYDSRAKGETVLQSRKRAQRTSTLDCDNDNDYDNE